MRQDTGNNLPLEARIEARASKIGGSIKETANRLRQEGLPERVVAGALATHEYIDDIIGQLNLRGQEKEKFILEFQAAVRVLAHGLVMGDGAERHQEQSNIANGNGALSREVSAGLKRAN